MFQSMVDAMDNDVSLDDLLTALRAVAESTRLRLLVLCSHGELTVSELAESAAETVPLPLSA